jgi:CRP-like cAMP-binding protein
MAAETLIDPLQRVALFQGLTQPQINLIARRAERVMFRIGQTIVSSGGAGDGAFLIVFGDAEVRTDDPINPEGRIVSVGSLIGEMAMLVEADYPATVVAKTAIRALKITRTALYTQMESDPDLAAHFVGKINGRLQAMAEDLRQIDRDLGLGGAAPAAVPALAQAVA